MHRPLIAACAPTVPAAAFAFAVYAASAVLPGCGAPGESSSGTAPYMPTATGDTEGSTGASATETRGGASGAAGSATSADVDDTGQTDASSGDGTASASTGTPTTTGATAYDGEPGEFTLDFEGRAYRLYVPSGYSSDTATPLVVGFHGAGDTGGNFYMIAQFVGFADAAEPAEFILLVPDTKSPLSDWANWSGNPNNDIDAMQQEMGEVFALINDIAIHYNLDDKHLHAFGFSNGGLFAGIAGLAAADQLATLTILGYGWGAGYLPPGQPPRTIPVQFGCGTNDSFYGGAQGSEGFLAGQGHDTRLVSVAGVRHSFSGIAGTMTPADMFAWMLARPAP